MMKQKQFLTKNQQSQICWKWTPTQATLKKAVDSQNNETQQWSLTPSISLTSPSEIGFDPSVRLFIDTETSISYSSKMGWFWHKTWNIPNVSVRLQITNENSRKPLMSPKNIFCEICCVLKQKSEEHSKEDILKQIKMRGTTKLQMVDGQVYYSGLKFSTSSQSLFGQYLHLLTIIYIQEDQKQKPKVLTAVISPGIFIISKTQILQMNSEHLLTFANLAKLPGSTLNQAFEITSHTNNFEGLSKQLDSPTSSKHPLTLSALFSNCILLYYSPENIDEKRRISQNMSPRDFLIYFQKCYLDENNGFLMKNSSTKAKKTISDYQKMCFLICLEGLEDSDEKNKIMQILSEIESESIGVVTRGKDEQFPAELRLKFQVFEKQSLVQTYWNTFSFLEQIFKAKMQQQISEQNSLLEAPPISKKVDHIKINKMNDGKGYTYETVSKERVKHPKKNIICHTIETYDRKPSPVLRTRNHTKKMQEIQSKHIPKLEQMSPEQLPKQPQKPEKIIKNHQSAFTNKVKNSQEEVPNQDFPPLASNLSPMNNILNLTNLANPYQPRQPNLLSMLNNNISYPIGGMNLPQASQYPYNMNNILNSGFNNYNLNPLGAMNGINNQMQPMMPDARVLQSSVNTLFCNNLLLSNWLQSVKQNNINLYEEAKRAQSDFNIADPSTIDNKYDIDESLNEDGLKYLNEQINLHKELLAQIMYQNQLLSQSIGMYLNSNQSPSGNNGQPKSNNSKQHESNQQNSKGRNL